MGACGALVRGPAAKSTMPYSQGARCNAAEPVNVELERPPPGLRGEARGLGLRPGTHADQITAT
jgi:hypothetical protein